MPDAIPVVLARIEAKLLEIEVKIDAPKSVQTLCHHCTGTGMVGEETCSYCSGKGVEKNSRITLTTEE